MKNRLLSTLILLLVIIQAFASNHPAKFIWKDAEGSGRQQKVLFRKNFELKGDPSKSESEFHIFADSRYHLYVNGTHINFGPSRFYAVNPQYDTHDIKDFLKKGDNVIAVEVLTNGMNTFQLDKSIGGFITWGSISSNSDDNVSLETPGEWKMLPVESMDTEAVKFSFATGALENQDLNKEPFGWQNASFDDNNWLKPILVKNQDHWGDMIARTAPNLTQEEKTPLSCVGIYNDKPTEEVLSFFVKYPDETQVAYNSGELMVGFTYIYSPKKQDVEIGTWWGTYYLNGNAEIKPISQGKNNLVRENRVFNLKKGWNYLFISYKAVWGAWEYTSAFPKNAGLIFNADKQKDGDVFFKTLSKLTQKQSDKYSSDFKSNDTKLTKSLKKLKWQSQPYSRVIRNPARELAWSQPDLSQNIYNNDYQVSGFETNETRYYVFDMGDKTLGRIFIDIDAPKGTRIEFGWSEDLNKNNIPSLFKRAQISSGARFTTNGLQKRYSTFKPFGVRFIYAKVTPANNQKVTINHLGVIEQIYPYNKVGSFECSDPMFNRFWGLGWRTLRVCSEDSYTDTPFRERGLYAGDALPEYAITLATSGDSRLMKKSLLLFQDMYHHEMTTGVDNRHNDFILKTLAESYWYYKYTADTTFATMVYANYKTYLNFVENKKTDAGYYEMGQGFFEWTSISKTSDLTAYQALLHGVFNMMNEMATDFGYTDDAKEFNKRANAIKTVINSKFWDDDKKAFFDGFEKGEKMDHCFPISSYYPLLFDVIDDKDRTQQIISFLDEETKDIGEVARNRKTTPYSSFYLFATLYENGEAGIAERYMKQYWSRMVHGGDDTSWEDFDIGDENSGSQGTASHAWSGHPTYFLSTEVLGVKFGFNQAFSRDTVLIQPQSESVSWAKGTVPHPAGPVSIDWKIKGDNLIFNVILPSDIPFIVEPKGRLAKLNLILNTEVAK